MAVVDFNSKTMPRSVGELSSSEGAKARNYGSVSNTVNPRLVRGGASPSGREARISDLLPGLKNVLSATLCMAAGGVALGVVAAFTAASPWLILGGIAFGFIVFATGYLINTISKRGDVMGG